MIKASVIGAGLAGCEAAWQLANAGIDMTLYEMKPLKFSPAHSYHGFAELVCSNSLKAAMLASAAGMLKEEMRLLDSLSMKCAAKSGVGAGGALAVDRELFSDLITEAIRSHKNISVINEEITKIPEGHVIIASGPLTTDKLADSIFNLLGEKRLSFYDAAAPIITADSIDMHKAYFAARYGRGEADYINCGMNSEQYEAFYNALLDGETAPLNEFDSRDYKVYEGCMPVEVMAKRGKDTLRFGPLKPVGLDNPITGQKYYAVLQLRKENAHSTMYNMVGFQTNLKFGEQKRIFSIIPGLENAEFVRYGIMHRNTFIDSPRLLDNHFRLKSNPSILFAGQITGVEGYMESASSGLYAGLTLARGLLGKHEFTLPKLTMMGALAAYISDESVSDFQPMGANMGILPPLEERIRNKQLRYEIIAKRGISALNYEIDKLGD